jgi:hypothetical protein
VLSPDLIGHKFLSGDIYFIDFLPSELHWLDVFYVLVTALLATQHPRRVDTAGAAGGIPAGQQTQQQCCHQHLTTQEELLKCTMDLTLAAAR